MTLSPLRRPPKDGGPPLCGWLLLLCVMCCPLAAATGEVKKRFNLQADLAENSLREFAAQSGAEVLFATKAVGKIRTNPIQGEYTSLEAMTRLLANTGLVAARDEVTGALTVSSAPNEQGTAQDMAGGRPTGKKKRTMKPLNLQES